ncbi:MAG: cell division protein FtsQ/DivIB [Prevotellaceae bacterium]|jgi:cell division protein FtsQ|nr:cell division protein FtsQ/DivIB [Prevotellaceae bacterium]
MKRISWYKVLLTFGISGILLYIVYAFVSDDDKSKQMVCKDISVEILNIDDAGFVTASTVCEIIEESKLAGKGKRLNDSVAIRVRKMLETKSYIKNVRAYPSGDGILHVSLEQRVPVVRIISSSGSCYLDAEGYAFPPSPDYVHDVPLVTGRVPLPYKLPYKGSMPEKGSQFAMKLLDFAAYISKDQFWNAQIQQINTDEKGNIELNMCAGKETVRLGQLDNYEFKLDKLMTFYNKVYPYLERNKYKSFDLRFGDQVVATSE